MKKLSFWVLSLVLFVSLLSPLVTEAKVVKVKSYYKPSTGKFVNTHYKTSSNSTRLDNYSTRGNYNPFTGKKGYVNPYKY